MIIRRIIAGILKAATGPVAEYITKVGVGEYFTSYLTNKGKIYATLFNGAINTWTDMGLTNVTDVDGAQYTNIALNSSGSVYIITKAGNGGFGSGGGVYTAMVGNDENGAAFTNNINVYGWFQTWLSIRNPGGTLWYWGDDSQSYGSLNLTGSNITAPKQLTQPTGRVISKVVTGDQDEKSFIVLCTDGSVWKYKRGDAGVPTQLTGISSVIDIGAIGRACWFAVTSSVIYTQGQFSAYANISEPTTTWQNVTSQWTGAGLVMPVKQVISNHNCIHFIDANDNLWAQGDNSMGEIGNGDEITPYRTYNHPGFTAPFSWDFARGQKMVTTPVQIRGKYKTVSSGTNIAFYFHAQDFHNKWYSWGRNKVYALGNGSRINNDDVYPCWGDVPAPVSVDASTVVWTFPEPNFNPATNIAPKANAGIDQDISGSTATIYGDYSFQQESTITTYAWSQISGPNTATITSASSANTGLTGLISGTYVFRITVTNSNSQSSTDDTTLYVT